MKFRGRREVVAAVAAAAAFALVDVVSYELI